MPRTALLSIALALLGAARAPTAHADDPAPAQRAPTDTDVPASGQCVEQNQLKRCYVAGLGAVFEVSVAQGTQLMVTVDEPLRRIVPPDDRYIDYVRRKGSRDFIVFELTSDSLPANITSSIKTASSTITIRFHAVKHDPDLQVHILHTDRAKHDALLAQCKADYQAADGARYRKKLVQLDAQVDRRARKRLVAQANAGDGFSVAAPGGTTIERHDFLVLRADKLLRVGTWRLVHVTVENMDRPAFALGALAVYAQRSDRASRLDADLHCDRRLIPGRHKARCVLALGGLDPVADGKVRIVATEKHGDRSVTLDGVDIR